MKFKKVKVLCMITAIGVVTVTASIQTKATKENQTAENGMSRTIDAGEAEVIGTREFSETMEEVSVSRMLIPNVASGNKTSEDEENTNEENADKENANEKNVTEENTENINKESTEAETVNADSENIDDNEESTEEKAAEEETLIIADVNSYVNIRSLPGTDGEILGKLYDDSVGQKLEEENGWYYITSGSVTGYVKAEYVLTGETARAKADEVGKRLAEVTTTTLKVRKEATTESIVLGLVPEGDILSVLEEQEGWVKVSVEEGDGYVSTDYVRLYTENVEAESREEEEARLRREEEARKAAEEAAKKAMQSQKPQNHSSGKPSAGSGSGSSGNLSSGNTNKPSGGSSSGNNTSNAHSGSSSVGQSSASSQSSGAGQSQESSSDLGQQIANYALKFLGNPYVYGGTSLTNGADCSGFVQSVYKHFGISLPRTSGEQGAAGRAVDGVKNAKPGDLVWYSGHIGIYIGNEQIVHASNSKVGIITSNVYYRNILGIRRII